MWPVAWSSRRKRPLVPIPFRCQNLGPTSTLAFGPCPASPRKVAFRYRTPRASPTYLPICLPLADSFPKHLIVVCSKQTLLTTTQPALLSTRRVPRLDLPPKRPLETLSSTSPPLQKKPRPARKVKMSEKEYTYQDVAEHNTKKDLFVVIHDKIYDCAKFVDEHP